MELSGFDAAIANVTIRDSIFTMNAHPHGKCESDLAPHRLLFSVYMPTYLALTVIVIVRLFEEETCHTRSA